MSTRCSKISSIGVSQDSLFVQPMADESGVSNRKPAKTTRTSLPVQPVKHYPPQCKSALEFFSTTGSDRIKQWILPSQWTENDAVNLVARWMLSAVWFSCFPPGCAHAGHYSPSVDSLALSLSLSVLWLFYFIIRAEYFSSSSFICCVSFISFTSFVASQYCSISRCAW